MPPCETAGPSAGPPSEPLPDPRLGAFLDDLGLAPGQALLLDSSALVRLVEGSGSPREAMALVLEGAAAGRLRIFASALAWAELLGASLPAETALAYRRLLSDSSRIVILPLDIAVAEEAAALAHLARRKSIADAIHAASALVARASALLTDDRDFLALARGRFRVILVEEAAAVLSMLQ